MDKSVGTLLHFWAFSNSPWPNPSPYPANNVGRVYPEVFRGSTLYRVGGGGGRESCKKISKKIHCFTREPRMTKKYKYCITVPRTFVHDCSLLPWVPACGRIFWGRHQADTSSAERLSHKWGGRDKKRVTMKSLAPRVLCRFIDSPFKVLLCPLVVQISLDTLATTGWFLDSVSRSFDFFMDRITASSPAERI